MVYTLFLFFLSDANCAIRVVGDDAVAADFDHMADVGFLVGRPTVHLQAALMGVLDGDLFEILMVRVDGRAAQRLRVGRGRAALIIQKAGIHVRVQLLKALDQRRVEAGNDGVADDVVLLSTS